MLIHFSVHTPLGKKWTDVVSSSWVLAVLPWPSCYSRLEISILFCPTHCSLTGSNTPLSLYKRLPIMVALKGGEKGKREERDATAQREMIIRMREIRFTECEGGNKDMILIWLQRMIILSLNWLFYRALIYVIRSLLCFNIYRQAECPEWSGLPQAGTTPVCFLKRA